MLGLGIMVVDIIPEREWRDIERVLVIEIIPAVESIAIVIVYTKIFSSTITNLLWLL